MPSSVTVEGGGSGSDPDPDCFSDASLQPPAIAVYNPDVLGVYFLHYTTSIMCNTCTVIGCSCYVVQIGGKLL